MIAIETTSLPQYTRMELTGNFVSASLDFGLPREVYIPEINYTEDKTLYAQYWKQFLGDQFNINTKKVTAFVRLDNLNNVNSQLLRDFYWFDNNIWMLNKIDSYNLNSDDTVKCEFIKINDVTNYTQGQLTVDRSLSITPPEAQLPYTAGTYTFRVTCTNPWSILSYNDIKITSISTTSGGPGSTDVTITYTENTSNAPEYFYVSIVIEGTVDSKSIDFVQAYNAETSITVSGIITNINNGEPVADARILTYDKETGGNYVNVTYSNAEGYYAITANKNELYYVEVQYDLELGDDTVYKLLQPASSTDVTLNIGVDIPVQEEGDASGTYYFTLIGPKSSTNNEHL